MDTVFKTYDIRGIVPQEFNTTIAQKIVQATLDFLKIKNKPAKIIVGRDGRISSPLIYQSVIKILKQYKNIKIIKLNLTTTPIFYWSISQLKADCGFMITASHNPKEYNGLKIMNKKNQPINPNDIKKYFNEKYNI
ncbi:MAG: hypothetical protein ACP5IC_02665 [Minisyncoccia bacterium]